MPRGDSKYGRRNRRIEGEDDEWITMTWKEKIDGKWENVSHTIRTEEGEKRMLKRVKRPSPAARKVRHR
jgi:hypothetical protein